MRRRHDSSTARIVFKRDDETVTSMGAAVVSSCPAMLATGIARSDAMNSVTFSLAPMALAGYAATPPCNLERPRAASDAIELRFATGTASNFQDSANHKEGG